MIKPSRNVVGVGGSGAAAILYGLLGTRRDSYTRPVWLIFGVSALACAAFAWKAADDEDKASTRHPELMNGHFLTDGRLSATSGDRTQIAELRDLLDLPPPTRRRTRGHRLRT